MKCVRACVRPGSASTSLAREFHGLNIDVVGGGQGGDPGAVREAGPGRGEHRGVSGRQQDAPPPPHL